MYSMYFVFSYFICPVYCSIDTNTCQYVRIKKLLLYSYVFYFLNPSIEKCDVCQRSFASRSSMLKHVREIHDKLTQHTYMQCSRIFSKKSNLTDI